LGVVIPNHLYDTEMEGLSIDILTTNYPEVMERIGLGTIAVGELYMDDPEGDELYRFLDQAQQAHDSIANQMGDKAGEITKHNAVPKYLENLKALALKYQLSIHTT